MKLSIVIPTYNEEKYLPILLKSIKSQCFNDYEIIVADANSCDNTVEIAKNYDCTIVEGGMPAVGRNNGAKVAKGDILLFLDSDLELTENYLEEVIEEFERENLDIGITQISPLSEKKLDKILHDLANWFMTAFEKIKPHGAGCYGIICKRELHEKYHGFDEDFSFGEDSDYIERLAKNNKFKVLRNPVINVSTRRLKKKGLYKLAKQYGKSTFNDFRGIRTNAEELEYGFGHETKDSLEKEDLVAKIKKISNNQSIINNKSHYKIDANRSEWKSFKLKNSSQKVKNHQKIIFYSVCGEGMGHAVRSAVILEELTKEENKDKYDIYIFSSNRAYEYLKDKFDNVFEICGFNIVYENNMVKNKRTLLNILKATPNDLKENYGILFKKARELKPNIIISDFENYSNILSKIINVPLISLDNIHIITQAIIDYPPHHRQDILTAKSVIKSCIMNPKRYIITSFFFPKIKNCEKSIIYPPVIRDKIRNLKTSYEDYILVYQTSSPSTKLLKALKEIDEKFIVYGSNKEGQVEKLTFRKFNEDKIYNDMSNAKAVITNGGFTLITEAIYLKKPIYTIPAIGNFEQILNGFYLDKLGYGEMHEKINTKTLKLFLDNLEKYQRNLEIVKNSDNKGIIQELENSIEIYSRE